jgi:hypothetical protein
MRMIKELDNYLFRIRDLHKLVGDVISGVPSGGLNFSPIALPEMQVSNTLAQLTMHIAGAEHFWIGEAIGGMPPTRDRDAEFRSRVRNSGELQEQLDKVLAETNAVLGSLQLQDLDRIRIVNEKEVPTRWAILHVIEHTALHLGHMELTYQIWAKGDNRPTPTWVSRLPPR